MVNAKYSSEKFYYYNFKPYSWPSQGHYKVGNAFNSQELIQYWSLIQKRSKKLKQIRDLGAGFDRSVAGFERDRLYALFLNSFDFL